MLIPQLNTQMGLRYVLSFPGKYHLTFIAW